MAFYRTAPVSSITHYARVIDRVTQTRGGPGPVHDADWSALIDPVSDENEVVVFVLDEHGVRGAWYCTVADLRTAPTISALANRART